MTTADGAKAEERTLDVSIVYGTQDIQPHKNTKFENA